MKVLVKSNNSQPDSLTSDQRSSFVEAHTQLTPGQHDRFIRAVRVWFDLQAKTFEFEDRAT